jgi:hypothetical protein
VKSQLPVLVKTGEILREQLKKIGIALDVRPLESNHYFEDLVGKKFDVAAARWSITVDPDMFYYPLQHSASPSNFCGFQSEEGDRCIEAYSGRTRARPRARRYTLTWCLVPGGGLADRVQQRDPTLLDEAERPRLGAAVLARAALRGGLDQLRPRAAPRQRPGRSPRRRAAAG